MCLFGEVQGWGKEVRLLGFARAWRLLRLGATVLAKAEAEHGDTKAVLRLAQATAREMKKQKEFAADRVRAEVEARKRVEGMLRGYKDEVETLSEALKIAAIDVAEAARDQMMEDDLENDLENDDSGEDDTAGNAGQDEGEGYEGEDFYEGEEKQRKQQGGGFVVNRDGTFEER